MSESNTTSGVQQLIDKLSQEGVAEGQRQAEDLLSQARAEANEILESAQQQADKKLQQAHAEAEQFRRAGEEALRLAARDAVREFGARIHNGFRQHLQELIRQEVKDPKLLQSMILVVARQATEDLEDEQIELLLSPQSITEEEARRRLQEGESDELTDFIEGLVGTSLREGFNVRLGHQRDPGMTVRIVNDNVEIELTDRAIGELLERHMLPRFRAIMRND